MDYEICGTDLQVLKIALKPGDSIIAEVGSLVYMDSGIKVETKVFQNGKSGKGLFEKSFINLWNTLL